VMAYVYTPPILYGSWPILHIQASPTLHKYLTCAIKVRLYGDSVKGDVIFLRKYVPTQEFFSVNIVCMAAVSCTCSNSEMKEQWWYMV